MEVRGAVRSAARGALPGGAGGGGDVRTEKKHDAEGVRAARALRVGALYARALYVRALYGALGDQRRQTLGGGGGATLQPAAQGPLRP